MKGAGAMVAGIGGGRGDSSHRPPPHYHGLCQIAYDYESPYLVHLRYIEWPLFLRILREPVSALNDLFSGHGG
jgi:hypothetical protein